MARWWLPAALATICCSASFAIGLPSLPDRTGAVRAMGQAAPGCVSRRFRGRRGIHVAGKGHWFRSPGIEECMPDQGQPGQLLHLVFGGELADLDNVQFRDLGKLDIVGIYPNYAAAYAAWKAKAQQTVDNAHMRYFIVHLHRLLDPQTDQRAKR
jgi:hypothetical protein